MNSQLERLSHVGHPSTCGIEIKALLRLVTLHAIDGLNAANSRMGKKILRIKINTFVFEHDPSQTNCGAAFANFQYMRYIAIYNDCKLLYIYIYIYIVIVQII